MKLLLIKEIKLDTTYDTQNAFLVFEIVSKIILPKKQVYADYLYKSTASI